MKLLFSVKARPKRSHCGLGYYMYMYVKFWGGGTDGRGRFMSQPFCTHCKITRSRCAYNRHVTIGSFARAHAPPEARHWKRTCVQQQQCIQSGALWIGATSLPGWGSGSRRAWWCPGAPSAPPSCPPSGSRTRDSSCSDTKIHDSSCSDTTAHQLSVFVFKQHTLQERTSLDFTNWYTPTCSFSTGAELAGWGRGG